MKYALIIIFSILFLFTSIASCNKDAAVSGNPGAVNNNGNNNPDPTGSQMKIKIGSRTLTSISTPC
jgi:hypothetical protein